MHALWSPFSVKTWNHLISAGPLLGRVYKSECTSTFSNIYFVLSQMSDRKKEWERNLLIRLHYYCYQMEAAAITPVFWPVHLLFGWKSPRCTREEMKCGAKKFSNGCLSQTGEAAVINKHNWQFNSALRFQSDLWWSEAWQADQVLARWLGKRRQKLETTGLWTGGGVPGRRLTSRQPPSRPGSFSAGESAAALTRVPAADTNTHKHKQKKMNPAVIKGESLTKMLKL